MKRIAVAFKAPSTKNDYACADGEIAASANITYMTGEVENELSPGQLGGGLAGQLGGGLAGQLGGRLVGLLGGGLAGQLGGGLAGLLGGGLVGGPETVGMPRLPVIRFALERRAVGGWQSTATSLPYAEMAAPRYPNADGWGMRALEMIERYRTEATRQGLHTAPFFVCYAYALAGGSHVGYTPPVLMIPNSTAPLVGGLADFSAETMRMTATMTACRLQFRITDAGEFAKDAGEFVNDAGEFVKDGGLADDGVTELWRRLITHVDVMVSDAVEVYDGKAQPSTYHRVSSDNFTHSLSASGMSGEERVSDETFPIAWKPRPREDYEIAQEMLKATSFRVVAHIPVSEISEGDSFVDVPFDRGSLSILPSLPAIKPDYLHYGVTPSSFAIMTPYCNERGWFPRWLFTPDTTKRQYDFVMDGMMYRVPLERHTGLAGSYWWRGMENRFFDPVKYLYTSGGDIAGGDGSDDNEGAEGYKTGYIETRPLKLGDAEARVRVMGVTLRGDCGRIELYGSDDLQGWRKIASGYGRGIEGIWSRPWRFHKLVIRTSAEAVIYGAAFTIM